MFTFSNVHINILQVVNTKNQQQRQDIERAGREKNKSRNENKKIRTNRETGFHKDNGIGRDR